MWQPHPHVPWIQFSSCNCPHGGYYAQDTRTGEQVHAPDIEAVHQFAADRSGGSGPRLGDHVHAMTQRLGIPRCGSCAKRQAALNSWFRR